MYAHGFRYYFTPLPGYFSPFPHGTCPLSVIWEYLGLAGGPARFTRDFSGPVLLGMISGPDTTFRLRGWHPLWLAFQNHSSISRCKPCFSAEKLEVPQPRTCNSCRISHMCGLASSAFARHYLRNHGCFLFLWVLRCFTSPRSLYPPYIFRRESLGRKAPSGVSPFGHPRITARLSAPRGLSQPPTSFIGF